MFVFIRNCQMSKILQHTVCIHACILFVIYIVPLALIWSGYCYDYDYDFDCDLISHYTIWHDMIWFWYDMTLYDMLVYYAHIHTWSRGPSCRFRLDLPLKGKDVSQPHSTHSPCLSNVETCSVVQPGGVGTCLQESTRHLPKKNAGHRQSMYSALRCL
jgi:hypothetical protein